MKKKTKPSEPLMKAFSVLLPPPCYRCQHDYDRHKYDVCYEPGCDCDGYVEPRPVDDENGLTHESRQRV